MTDTCFHAPRVWGRGGAVVDWAPFLCRLAVVVVVAYPLAVLNVQVQFQKQAASNPTSRRRTLWPIEKHICCTINQPINQSILQNHTEVKCSGVRYSFY
jgi:hypothetical protein